MDCQREIRKYLKQVDSATVTEILQGVSFHYEKDGDLKIRNILKEMVKNGTIEKIGTSTYKWLTDHKEPVKYPLKDSFNYKMF